jgi:hypothetical protein
MPCTIMIYVTPDALTDHALVVHTLRSGATVRFKCVDNTTTGSQEEID